jgi:S1-C subfamily serine protease
MKRMTLYSTSSSRMRSAASPKGGDQPDKVGGTAQLGATSSVQAAGQPPGRPWRKFYVRHERVILLAIGGLLIFAAAHWMTPPPLRSLTQEDIDAAVLRTLETKPLPSREAKAYEIVRPSVVRVHGHAQEGAQEGEVETEHGVGTGVVIVDKGVILTNLHVVAGAKRVSVVFSDGLESDAMVIGMRPEHDLAVLQAKTIPDDLMAATMGSTKELALGDHVIAVGFPFGIGPSVTAGVVSGLRREFHSPQGKRVLTNLIQFDAAANPGSSGGPLVTSNGEVVGIVTGILNPTEQRVFVGIAFAVPIENAAGAAGVHPF